MVFTLFAQTTFSASAATAGSNTQASTYVYNGITYSIEKSTLSDGSTQVDVTSPNESDEVVYNQTKNTVSIAQTLPSPQNPNVRTTTKKTINRNNIKTPVKPTRPTNSDNKLHSGGFSSLYKTSPELTSSGDVYNIEWGFEAYYEINTSVYGSGNEYYYLYTPDVDGGYYFYDTVKISSAEYNLCSSYYSDVSAINSDFVGAAAYVGAAGCSAVAGIITGAETLTIGLIIGVVAALGLTAGSATYFYGAWANAQAADKVFEEICASYS